MASTSPGEPTGDASARQGPGSGSTGYASADSSRGKSPLSLGLDFLKNIGSSSDKKSTRDGQPQKRRGPKPDAKPALTRRQELNRQAQRTHRERKEIYIKALEDQVMQLKEVYTGEIQEKKAILDENRKLKELLQLHDIPYPSLDNTAAAPNAAISAFAPNPGVFQASQSYVPPASAISSGPTLGGYKAPSRQDLPPVPGAQHQPQPQHQTHSRSASQSQQRLHPMYQQQQRQHQQQQQQQQQQQAGLDHDQLGVDFVLSLEHQCMNHLQGLCVTSMQTAEPTPNGHSMMLSCPPFSHLVNTPQVAYDPFVQLATPLQRLLDLSRQLPIAPDGEITPIMALDLLRQHPRYPEFDVADFRTLVADLAAMTRCYGFGAVLEEFEFDDAVSRVLATKPDFTLAYS